MTREKYTSNNKLKEKCVCVGGWWSRPVCVFVCVYVCVGVCVGVCVCACVCVCVCDQQHHTYWVCAEELLWLVRLPLG